jgi:hypothetical protein
VQTAADRKENAELSSRSTAENRTRLARFLADLLDQRFTIPGTSIRIGLDPLIGLIPGIGDAVANLTGTLIILIAARCNVPKIVLIRMGLNVAANALIGAVPFFGDILSIWFRSNVRNADLLERYATGAPGRAAWSDWLFVIAILTVVVLILAAIILALIWLLRSIG